MSRTSRGFSLLEVVIASTILIVVILIIYAVFDSSDKTYRTQVPMREAQVNVQKILELASSEATESGLDFIWGAAITGETHPGQLNTALVWPSARDASNQFMTNASGTPMWQKTRALIPLNHPDGTTVSLYRFEIPTVPPAVPACYPRIVVTALDVSIQWLRVSDNGIQLTSTAVLRTAGIAQLPNMNLFAITPVSTMGNPSGGAPISLDVIKLEAYVSVKAPQGPPVIVGTQTSIRGRN